MPEELGDAHYKHITSFINKNNLFIKNKEIFIVSAQGLILMFKISGSVLLTLNEELHMYVQVKNLSDYYKKKNISYAFSLENGDIVKIDSLFKNVFIYDNSMINILKLNFFEVFNLNKDLFLDKLKNNKYFLKLSHELILSKIYKTLLNKDFIKSINSNPYTKNYNKFFYKNNFLF